MPGEFDEECALDELVFRLSQHLDEGISVLKRSLHDDTHRRLAGLYFLFWPEPVDDDSIEQPSHRARKLSAIAKIDCRSHGFGGDQLNRLEALKGAGTF